MEFNTKLSKLIACRKEYNKYYENIDVIVNDKGKVVLE